MPRTFVISRTGGRRLMVCLGDDRAEYVEDDPSNLRKCLGYLGIKQGIPAALAKLRAALDRFYRLEARSPAKFGPPRTFRIWRVDPKVLQIDYKGGYAELRGRNPSDVTLKRCLEDMGANAFLLGDLKRELAEFLRNETDAE